MSLSAVIWDALGGLADFPDRLAVTGDGALASAFAVTELASASIGAAALAIAELAGTNATVTVDRRLASFWFGWSLQPIGWTMPDPGDPMTGDYVTQDGWIRLHTNAPHHSAAAQFVLGTHASNESTARAVACWKKHDLETAIVAAGGCAAEMRSISAWAQHPQGSAVAAEPLIHSQAIGHAVTGWKPKPHRPLDGLRVLDLTRILAGPVATRFLAGFGADVLRIDPPGWEEPGVVPEVTLGKRCARLNLKSPEGRARFEAVLASADILIHGYRSDALDRLGYTAEARRAVAPGLIDVSLSAYGWTGPWATRRGFDSLVQMSTGIAEAGMHWRNKEVPVPLPVQALDHATGTLIAATAIRAVTRRQQTGSGTLARLSLSRIAKLLTDTGLARPQPLLAPKTSIDFSPIPEATAWGMAHRLNPPAEIPGIQMKWPLPAGNLGNDAPQWLVR